MRFCWLLCLGICLSASAQKIPTIEEKTKEFKKYEGFLDFYWDENTGKLWLEIDQFDTEILYIVSLPAGLGSNDIGLDRGLLGDRRIVRFSRTGRKVLMIQPNYSYRAVNGAPLEKKTVEESFAQSAIWGFNVEAESNGHALVDATDLVVRDAMLAANTIKNQRQGNFSFDRNRSVVYLPRTKNFPLNTEMEAMITLANTDGIVGNFVNSVTPSGESITLRMHHSFVKLPDSGYTPRVFDPRSSFGAMSYFDFSTPVSEPIDKYFIPRHRLKKKDPSAAVSEAVEPIIYYLDNGTPEPIRSALLEGAGWWNQAFEAAGYKNAFQVKILPEDADPMDVRYNVINWVHRATRGWSYGNSVTDPRTGEIIKGHVTLGSLRVRQDYLIATGLLAPYENGVPADNRMLKMALERLKQLSAHEVGHTLGLMHNYASSVSDRASVMDYPHPVVRVNRRGDIDLGEAYDNKIGEWDKVAITWGYQDFPPGTDEKKALDKIMSDAAKKGLQFIADRDARAPGGLHPQAHLWDNGKNAVVELGEVMKVRAKALEEFGEKNIRPGMPMAMLEDVLVPVYLFHRYQLEAVTKMVGGMYYNYAIRGDGQLVTKALTKDQQQKALQAIINTLDPKVLAIPDKISRLIPPRPAGYGFGRELFRKRTGLSFDVLAPAETAVDMPLSFLFNPERLSRMVQFETAGGLGADEMIRQLINSTWEAPRRQGMERLIQLQTEQLLLTYLLAATQDENASFAVRAIALKAVTDLKKWIETKNTGIADEIYSGHLLLALDRIKTPDKAKATQHREMPPGAPIGCDME